MGVHVLLQLVLEVNTSDSSRSLSLHRKVSASFRDSNLYDILSLSFTLLRQINVEQVKSAT